MSNLQDVLIRHVGHGMAPGAVGLVARGDHVEVAAVGSMDTGGSAAMARESIFRIASITKPIIAAAVMMLVEEGSLALDESVARWLPELAKPVVVRTPQSPLDDVVPAARGITVLDLLTLRSGHGFPSDFGLPAVQPLFGELGQGPVAPAMAPNDWMATLSRIPLLYQPGEKWLYNTGSDILGVLISRAAGQPLPEFLAERVFEPLRMVDTGFWVPAAKLDRFTTAYRLGQEGVVELVDRPKGIWSAPPAFPSGAGGLVSTVDDWSNFARMLLGSGMFNGRRVLSADSVRQMTTDQLTENQRAESILFLEGQGWGFGGSVDVAVIDPWNVPGRYGWVGGTGTAAHLTPSTGAVSILLTQLEMTGPTVPSIMSDFWRYAM